MTKEMLTVFLIVAGLSAMIGTANAAVAQDAVPNAVSDVAAGSSKGTAGVLRTPEVLPPGLFIEAENGTMVELTDEPDDETVQQTDADIGELVFFHLFTKENPTTSQSIVPGDTVGLHDTNWDASKPTRIVTHGWQSSSTAKACILPRDAYLQHGDYNVIVVDWSNIAKWTYGYAQRRVGIVGEYVGKLIDFLKEDGMDVSQLVISGHSLGGHIAGLSARHAQNTVGYVVALDPAGPSFRSAGPGERVDATDAANVQVIHTNGGGILTLGLATNVGHVDFHPNGGVDQPGCWVPTCSHSRAFHYFAESINSDVGFHGKLCASPTELSAELCQAEETVRMGGTPPVPVPTAGSYFLETADAAPFAKAA